MRRPARSHAGFTLLAILLALAAASLLVLISLQLGLDERRSASLARHDARARAIAEAGLERTRAYLGALLATNMDLDRVLDPKLDTLCTGLPLLSTGTEDDHLPVFINPATSKQWDAVPMPGSNKRFLRVPHEEGAYLVRIDDNDDDAELLGFGPTTSNNIGGISGCLEGPLPGLGKNNPVRDRDQMVTVTVVGIYPGTDVATAQARKVLRVRVGPLPAAGIIAGGSIDMKGSSHVCGAHGDVYSSGDITGGCLCGVGCKGGPSYQDCGTNNTCTAEAGGSTCTATGGGSASVCIPGAVVPPPPVVSPWSSSNAPVACTTPPCTPFYYLRNNGGTAQVYMWDYSKAGCSEPQSCSRLAHPGEAPTGPCSACWSLVYDAVAHCSGVGTSANEVRIADDLTLTNTSPSRTTGCGKSTPVVWERDTASSGFTPGSNCDTGSGLYPGPANSQWDKHTTYKDTFVYRATDTNRLPRGIWLVEGNVHFNNKAGTPACAAQPPGWRVSVMATGNVTSEAELFLRPASPRSIVMLSGRDTEFKTGNTRLHTCDESGAVVVHEQFAMGSNAHLEAQLVVENKGTCSSTVSGEAVALHGNATINVTQTPIIAAGAPVAVLDWSESSY